MDLDNLLLNLSSQVKNKTKDTETKKVLILMTDVVSCQL